MNEIVKEVAESHLCACGCGEETDINKRSKLPNRFIPGHQNRGRKHTEEHRRKNSEANMGEKNHFYGKEHSEESKIKMSKSHTGVVRSEETNKKQSETNKRNKVNVGEKNGMYGMNGDKNPFFGREHTEETKQKLSKIRKEKYSGENHNMFGKKHSEETKMRMSEVKKGKKASDETRLKMSESHSGENHYNWQGGKSFEPYCPKFNEAFKEEIRDKFDRICFICGKTEYENCGRKLSVHHVEYNKNCGCDDSLSCDFVPLCMSCHAKTSNSRRNYWEKEIIKKLKTL